MYNSVLTFQMWFFKLILRANFTELKKPFSFIICAIKINVSLTTKLNNSQNIFLPLFTKEKPLLEKKQNACKLDLHIL